MESAPRVPGQIYDSDGNPIEHSTYGVDDTDRSAIVDSMPQTD